MVHNKEIGMKTPKIYLPLIAKPICGHSLKPFTNIFGREEGILIIHKNGFDFIASIETGPCEKCNKEQEKRYRKMAKNASLNIDKNGKFKKQMDYESRLKFLRSVAHGFYVENQKLKRIIANKARVKPLKYP